MTDVASQRILISERWSLIRHIADWSFGRSTGTALRRLL